MVNGIPDRAVPQDPMLLLWAFVAHASPIVLSVLGPLLIGYLKRDNDFVRYHAAQATYFSAFTLGILLISCGAGGLIVPFMWVWGLYVGLRAREGEWCGYPGVSRFGYGGIL